MFLVRMVLIRMMVIAIVVYIIVEYVKIKAYAPLAVLDITYHKPRMSVWVVLKGARLALMSIIVHLAPDSMN